MKPNRTALIKPIPKHSNMHRTFTIHRHICILYKIYSPILNDRLTNLFFEEHALYVEIQNGLRKGFPCEKHIFALASILRKKLCSKNSAFNAYLDADKIKR